MSAKLLVRDPNGVVIFDSSVHKIMSHLLTHRWSYNISPTVQAASIRISDARIKPNSTFIHIVFVSVSANVMAYHSSSLISIKYYDGYADITMPPASTSSATITVTYDIKVFSR